jgi:hypothetical protein
LKALARLRFSKIDPLKVVGKMNEAGPGRPGLNTSTVASNKS